MILNSINGTDLTPVQKSRIELVNNHIKQLSSNIQRLDKLIDLMIEPYDMLLQVFFWQSQYKHASFHVVLKSY